MKNKNLIKKVSFRGDDFKGVEGGGDSSLKKWVKDEYSEEKLERLLNETNKIEEFVKKRKKEYKKFPVIVEAKINKKAKAKEYREKMHQVFVKNNIGTIVGMKKDNKILYSVNSNHLSEINDKLKLSKGSKENKTLIASIDSIKRFEVPPVEDFSKIKHLKVKLIKYSDKALQNEEERILYEKLDEIRIDKLEYPNGEIVYEMLNTTSQDVWDVLFDLPFVESVEEMPELDFLEELNFDFFNQPSIPLLDANRNYPIVGLFDSGVNRDVIGDWCIKEYSPYIPEDINYEHGTSVGSLICFGKELNDKNLGVEGCKIISCVARSNDKKTTEAEVLYNLEEALKRYSNKAKIWNLSLGLKGEISEESFSDFAINLDALQEEYGVLFIKSAGNCKALTNSRLNRGAESLRALTVGSIAQEKVFESKENQLSQFSRIGPGPLNTVKPELVYYGGAICKSNREIIKGINVIGGKGKKIEKIGPSFSTPQISSLIAHIDKRLNGDFDPLLVKGLVIHKASYLQEMLEEENSIKSKYGYGVPKKIDDIFFESENEYTMVFRGKIPKGDFIETLDIPYPKELIGEDGYYDGEVVVTSIINPILVGSQGWEYSQVDLEVMFGTYKEKEVRDISNPRVKYELGKVDQLNILAKNLTSKKIDNSNVEEALRKNGKYAPLKKYTVNLSNFTPAHREKLLSDRFWYLKLDPTYHKYVEDTVSRNELFLEYCVFVTIKSKDKPINSSLQTELDINGFNPLDIELNVENIIEVQ